MAAETVAARRIEHNEDDVGKITHGSAQLSCSPSVKARLAIGYEVLELTAI
jgi:hypothetical protein